MTESQKALSQFIAFINKHAPNKVDEISSAISEMKKLVDKDKPKMALSTEEHDLDYVCACATFVNEEMNYCPNCGQALDWME